MPHISTKALAITAIIFATMAVINWAIVIYILLTR